MIYKGDVFMKYYSLKKIKEKNADYNLIIGERSNGKTYSCKKYRNSFDIDIWKSQGSRCI